MPSLCENTTHWEIITARGCTRTIAYCSSTVISYSCFFVVVGCQDVFPPVHAFAKRSGDNVVVKCKQTGETWYLTCKDDKWIGEYGNCTAKQYVNDRLGSNSYSQGSKNYFCNSFLKSWRR